jgi:myxalamid-type polyketide synthase MxaB
LYDADGEVLVEIRGFELRPAPRQAFLRRQMADWLYRLEWQPQPFSADRVLTTDGAEAQRFDGRSAPAPMPASSPAAAGFAAAGSAPPAGSWLVVGRGPPAAALAERLRDAGHTCLIVSPGADLPELPHNCAGAIYFTRPATDNNMALSVPHGQRHDVVRATGREAAHALQLAQHLLAADTPTRLWLVTCGAQAVTGTEPIDIDAAGLWGLGRTLTLECPQLQTVCVDLEGGPHDFDHLLAELNASRAEAHPMRPGPQSGHHTVPQPNDAATESQIAWRAGVRHVARLQRLRDSRKTLERPSEPFRLQLAEYGSPDQLTLAPRPRRTPGPGEVEVEVRATALNFRDVLNSLGLLADYYRNVLGIERAADIPLGFDCAGVVTAVGPDITDIQAGDEVMVAAAGASTSHLTIWRACVARKPAALSFEAASALPSVFLTAWHALERLARLGPGERVLIHAAAGGVGQAAVQIAQAKGAEIFATASPAKWEALRRQGVAHVMNSRTLDFADEIMRLTHGEGVDVVLNSLSGDVIDKSLDVVRHGGRYVEIGKLGILDPAEVTRRRPDVRYFTFDLGEETAGDPEWLQTTLDTLRQKFESAELKPLPFAVFPIEEAIEAYRTMQQARHVGKVVLSFAPAPQAIRSDASYLITGGLGALGLEVARYLVSRGARQIVLSSRKAAVSTNALDALREAGATVVVAPADVASADDVTRLLDQCQALAPLRGIVHAAGVLDDGILEKQTAERFRRVFAPKVEGALHLHEQTAESSLDFFVCFSSMASLLGSPGQSNYASANACLDALCQHRRARGLPALSINWGPFANVGMAAHLDMTGQGVDKMDAPSGMDVMGSLLDARSTPAQVAVMRIHWGAFTQGAPPAFLSLVSPLARQSAPARASASDDSVLRRLQDASLEEREKQLQSYLQEQLLSVLGLDASQPLSPTQSWSGLGLDSLMTVELKNRLERSLRVTLPVDKLTRDTQTLSQFILTKIQAAPAESATPDLPDPEPETDELAAVYARVQQIPQAFLTATRQEGRRVLIDGRWRRDFASCNYLGLDLEPQVSEAAIAAMKEWGTHPSWTRAVASPAIYDELERKLAALLGCHSVLVFPSVTLLHMGTLPLLAGPHGVILKDTAAHHSVHEGCLRAQVEGAEWLEFKHNDAADLENKLARYRPQRTKIIAIDGVYSMGGPYPPLREYVALAEKYSAIIYADDAHGFGLLGEHPDAAHPYGYRGNGIVRHAGLDYERIVYVAGLSKAFSSYGAFVTCRDDATRALLRSAGPYVFSGPTSVASLASALAGLELNERDGDARRGRIHALTQRLLMAARDLGFEVDNGDGFPIVSVVIGEWNDMVTACTTLWEHDILITPAMYPAVPMNRNLVRFSITSANTDEDVDAAVEALRAVRERLRSPLEVGV